MAQHEVQSNIKPGFSQRYKLMLHPVSAGAQSNAKDYVQFLQDQERKVGPDGFLDSKRFTNSYTIKSGSTRSKSLSCINGKTVVDLSVKKARDLEDHEHRLKAIENAMWQHKQEERVLSRAQGDVWKKQRALKRMVRDCETAVERKILDDKRKMKELKLQQESAKQQFLQTREQVSRSNLLQSRLEIQSAREQDQKSSRTMTRLELRYAQMFLEMKKRHAEIETLHREYEEKLKRKEHEEFQLKKALAELATAVSTEAQSNRGLKSELKRSQNSKQGERILESNLQATEFVNEQLQIEKQMRDLEAERGALNRDLPVAKSFLNEKSAKESRNILELGHQLEQNLSSQRRSAEEYSILRSKKLNRTPKVSAVEHLQQDVVELQPILSGLGTPFSIGQEERRKTLTESIKHLQKSVSNATDSEKLLFKNMRAAETSWEKQEKVVARLRDSLTAVRKENSSQVQKSLSDANKKEQQLIWQLLREQAQLRKYQSQKEDNFGKLLRHRSLMKEEQLQLQQAEQERARIAKMTERTQMEQHALTGS
ncbi:myosin heavy chain, embryonic smooth muscle isoform-like [Ambystoma mexicanum]|uniref:myosin heavy chain, embryonic smooth muscle isoform-like n=1 Tax=Ambystoma mexicanum TaxID=8296 RepID=UPI0037E8297D